MKRVLLKIGTLNLPKDRWLDALNIFSEIHVVCFCDETELNHSQIIYHKFPNHKKINRLLYRILIHTDRYQFLDCISYIMLQFIRIINQSFIKSVKNIYFDAIHSSYNDFDESAFLTVIFGFKNRLTRAQKETRPCYSFLERKCFKQADLIVLNDKVNAAFYEKKYRDIFSGKKLLFGLDEDVRRKGLRTAIRYSPKYSEQDGRIHAVILAGRVLSDSNDARSGGRLYYIPIIKELLEAGIVVHLHAGHIVEHDGRNLYKKISDCNEDFIIEQSLDFVNHRMDAYFTLSKYDIGILHAHMEGAQVTKFDKVNIPHRYYEYELAHVVPVERRGKNILIEKKASLGYAVICDSFSDISLENIKDVKWDTPDFDSYIRRIYESRQIYE